MTSGTLVETTAVPGLIRDRRRSFRAPVTKAAVWLAIGVAVTALLWWAIWFFDGTLDLAGGQLVAARIAEVAVAVAALVVPLAGLAGLRAALRAGALAREDNLTEARVAADDARQATWYVVGFGLTAVILAFLFWFFGANDGRVREVLFNWQYPGKHLDDFAKGFWINIKIFMVAEVLVLVWALVVALVRMIPGRAGAPLRWLAIAYADLFRGIPSILVLFIVVFGFPLAGVPFFSSLGREDQLFWLAVLAFTLTYGAYVSEVYRSGLESIHWSQTAAARSLGLSQPQTLRYVVVPQAVRRIIPPLLNDFIGLQKDTALVSVVGVLDVVNRATILKGQDFNLTYLTGAAICFLIITIPMTRLTDWLVKRDAARMRAYG
jgi:polar amino acid transport system permease protein